MKTRPYFIDAALIAIIILVIPSQSTTAQDRSRWLYVSSSQTDRIYISPNRTTREKDGKLMAWFKWVSRSDTKEGQESYRNVVDYLNSKLEEGGGGGDALGFMYEMVEVDCRKQAMRSLSRIYYSRAGQELYTDNTEDSDFIYIIPDSLAEFQWSAVCKPQSNTRHK